MRPLPYTVKLFRRLANLRMALLVWVLLARTTFAQGPARSP